VCNIFRKTDLFNKNDFFYFSDIRLVCDNVLPDQGYRTTQDAVRDEYGAVVEWRVTEKNLLQ
jgi:hypothetical protein